MADNGSGMSQQQREAAFRRFVSSTSGETGLGLAIVHRLVTSNERVRCLVGYPGGGLTVTLELPGAQRDLLALRADGSAGGATILYQS